VRKLNVEISQIKVKLERENRWTHSSRIVNQLSERNHNERAGIGFYNDKVVTTDFFYICSKHGHPTTKCPVARNDRNKNVEIATISYVKTNHRIRNKIGCQNGQKEILFTPSIIRKEPSLSGFLKLTFKMLASKSERKQALVHE